MRGSLPHVLTGLGLSLLAVAGMVLFATPAHAQEVMNDWCSNEVAIVPSFDATPDTPGTIILQRGPDGWSNWTAPIHVALSQKGRIRWWCHSTTGNWLDPGTWRINETEVTVHCAYSDDNSEKPALEVLASSGDGVGSSDVGEGSNDDSSDGGSGSNCGVDVKFHLGSSARGGWTPERSRCGDRSSWVSARLGPERLLQISCLGN